MGAVLLAAEAAAAAASAHRACGCRDRHRTSLARARMLAAGCDGARTVALRDLGAPPQLSDLTVREREAIGLAAEGLTNRQIASRLYISIRTVNAHLSHAYAKLGTSDRSQLSVLVGPSPGPMATAPD
jgi:DNA-binding CsgD family transcriptional regulator